ncbi:MAG: Lrp/AsnC family transcriptional regulator [Pseudomonadales bacterium]
MLDQYDKGILICLQEDADLSLADIAERVNLTKNPCWRRIQKLQAAGVVRKKVALLDAQKIGVGVTVFINVRTNQHTSEWLRQFADVVHSIPEIVEFYRMSGDVDYKLKVVVPSIQAFDAVYKRLISKIDIYDVSSQFAMEEIKNTTVLPLEYC